jgi:hypothetical protein
VSQDSNAAAQDALPAAARMMIPGPEYDLIRRMVGQWQVNMRIWPADGAEPMVAPPMVATRELVRDAYLQEVMEAALGTDQDPFTRIAYLSFNNARRRYEYLSMDTRAPGMMYETTYGDELEEPGTIALYLDNFTFPGWGQELTGQLVKQRRLLSVQDDDTTLCRQYWTLPAAAPYLSVEYIYKRI